MDISYFQKINNTYQSNSRQETDLYLLNRNVDECFSDSIDYHVVKKNGHPYELLIIKDTDGNTFRKKIKAKHSTPFNLGDYIIWNGQMWIVTLLDPNDKTYHSGYMCLCTILLRWQNPDGKIIERWAYSEDFTKYSSGTTGNNTITIGDNQYGLTIPIDSETKRLSRDIRFPIDFDDAEKPDIYILTNRKVCLNNNEYFGRGGTMILTLSFNAFSPEFDKRVTLDDGKEIWICDYKEPTLSPPPLLPDDETTVLMPVISGGNTLRCGRAKSWTVSFKDTIGNIIEDNNFNWNVVSNFDLTQTISGSKIQIKTDDESLIGESFVLQVIVGLVVTEYKITITEGF